MTLRPVALLVVLTLAFASCERVKDIAQRARGLAQQKITGASGGEAADPALHALINESPDGFLFRRDLPFPKTLEVRVTQTLHFKRARTFQNSALGAQSTSLDGKSRLVSRINRAGDTVRVTVESVGRTVADPGNPDKEIVEETVGGLGGSSAEFRRGGNSSWKARPTTDFKSAVWSQELEDVLPSLLADHGAFPRTQWFGQRRIRIGDKIPLTGESLALLFGEGATGAVNLTLESTGAVAGHPCGVFTIGGDFRRRAAPAPDGNVYDEDVTIESGKIWLSLLYPVVLREELDTVQTRMSGKGSGPSVRLQGAIAVSTLREWKPN